MESSERAVGHLFGMVGGALIAVGGLIAVAMGVVGAALGRGFGYEVAALSEAVLLFVVGGLVLFFTQLGVRGWNERPVASGVMLVILALIGWTVLGLGGNLVALVGGLFALLAGILFLIEPTQRAAHAIVASS
jgi:hypothetical protein